MIDTGGTVGLAEGIIDDTWFFPLNWKERREIYCICVLHFGPDRGKVYT